MTRHSAIGRPKRTCPAQKPKPTKPVCFCLDQERPEILLLSRSRVVVYSWGGGGAWYSHRRERRPKRSPPPFCSAHFGPVVGTCGPICRSCWHYSYYIIPLLFLLFASSAITCYFMKVALYNISGYRYPS